MLIRCFCSFWTQFPSLDNSVPCPLVLLVPLASFCPGPLRGNVRWCPGLRKIESALPGAFPQWCCQWYFLFPSPSSSLRAPHLPVTSPCPAPAFLLSSTLFIWMASSSSILVTTSPTLHHPGPVEAPPPHGSSAAPSHQRYISEPLHL